MNSDLISVFFSLKLNKNRFDLLNKIWNSEPLNIFQKVVIKEVSDHHLSECFVWDDTLVFVFQVAFQGISYSEIRELIADDQVLDLSEDFN